MNLITVDIGSYSVKIIHSHLEKKSLVHDKTEYIVLDLDKINVLEEHAIWDLQIRVISEYLLSFEEEYKLVLNAPSEILTTRIKELPIGNKKKARLMLPFQLEEDIPFSLTDAHFASSIRPQKNESRVLVNLARKNEFSPFYKKIVEYALFPRLITSEVSTYETFVKNYQERFPTTFCILDMGHDSTKAYFFLEGNLTSTHSSFTSGKTITETISESYKIELEEALIYKHKNCFVLTNDQFDSLDQNQITFAKLMDKTLSPFIQEFKRWELGFRIKYGYNISEVLITGGTSNIKNIQNYLTQEFGIKVNYLNAFEINEVFIKETDPISIRKFNTAHVMSYAQQKMGQFINLLSGDFSLGQAFKFPLDTFFLFSSRVAILCLVLILSLMAENLFIKRDISKLDKKITPILKNNTITLTARQKRLALTQPKETINALRKKNKIIEDKISTLKSAIEINSLSSLHKIISLVEDNSAELTQFSSLSKGDFNLILKGKNISDLKKIDENFQASDFKNLFVDLNEEELTLTINGSEE